MERTTKWLFSASVSLAFVAGCIPANAEVPDNKVRFNNNNYESGYSGSVWGTQYYPFRQINLKVFSNSSEGDFEGLSGLKNYWEVHEPDGNEFTTSGQKLDLDTFENLGLKPTLQFFGDWSEAYKEVLSGDISLGGDIYNSEDAFSHTKFSYFYEDIPIICKGNVDCGKWQSANPEGVKVQIGPFSCDYATFSIYGSNNPNLIGDIDQGAGSCFEQDDKGVKVPTTKTCATDDEKSSGDYTSLKVEDDGTLSLGGNLIIEDNFTSFEVQNNALVEGSEGLVKTGSQTTVLKGTGTFAYNGDVYIQGGVLEITNATGLGSTESGTYVEEGAVLRISVDRESTPQGSLTKDITINEKITLAGGELDLNGNYIDLKGGVVLEGKDVKSTIRVKDGSTEVFARSIISGKGGLIKDGKGFLRLGGRGPQTYEGVTIIEAGELRFADSTSTPETTDVTVTEGATLRLMGVGNKIQSLSGSGRLILENEISILTSGLSGKDDEFSGVISGDGGFTKVGKGTTTLSGKNTYTGETIINEGRLTLANVSAIDPRSSTIVSGDTAQLDLYTFSANGSFDEGKEFEINRVKVKPGGRLFVSARNPLVSQSIELDAESGGIAVEIFEKTEGRERNKAPIRVSDEFVYTSGSLVVKAPLEDDPEGRWNIIDGKVTNEDKLAKNTFLSVGGLTRTNYQFEGLDAPIYGPAMYKGYLEEGSLDLVIKAKTPEELECQLRPEDCTIDLPSPDEEVVNLPPIYLPSPNEEVGQLPPIDMPSPDAPQVDNELPDLDGDGIPDNKDPDDDGDGELDQLPGCEVGDDLCDIISDIPGDEDEAQEEEEEVANEIIDGLLDGLEEEEIDLPLSFDYGQLARLIGSGLAPRNVDAAGRGLGLHNNLMVDAVFERQPLRQFEELLVSDAVVEESIVEEEAGAVDAAPVQPLWLKSEELSDTDASAYVEGALGNVRMAKAPSEASKSAAAQAVVIEVDGLSFVDQQDAELDLAKRDGVSAWVKGFGGNSRADDSSILYNDYDLNAYGTSFGVDVALSESFQIGAYANYGDLNVNQRSGDTGGGSWNPEGWGGGLTAQYSTRHFYVQGLLGASEFSGEQTRNILQINNDLGGNTARGDKSVTSYLGAMRIGAPFKTGGVVLEPQGQVVWTRNHEQGFSETSGTEKNLRLKYKSRTTNFAETELGMKLSVPIRTGERALLVPSLRAAWLADWNQGNEGQEIGYKFTKRTATFDSQLDTQNGALIEAGLDYTIQNFNRTSVKLYARGGMEIWNSDRGTTWRGSGGVTFQF